MKLTGLPTPLALSNVPQRETFLYDAETFLFI